MQVFNSSPDETAFFRTVLIRENVNNSLVMIQPTLMAYSLEGPAEPVMLDVSACNPNRILVLDTFFHFVIWCQAIARPTRSHVTHRLHCKRDTALSPTRTTPFDHHSITIRSPFDRHSITIRSSTTPKPLPPQATAAHTHLIDPPPTQVW